MKKEKRSKKAHITLSADIVNIIEDVIYESPDTISKTKLVHEINKAVLETHEPYIKNQFRNAVKRTTGIRFIEVLGETWRPVMMFLFIIVLFNQFITIPIIRYFIPDFVPYEIPESGWTLLIASMTGLVLSRGAEKIATTWKGNGSSNGFQYPPDSESYDDEWVPDSNVTQKGKTNIYISKAKTPDEYDSSGNKEDELV